METKNKSSKQKWMLRDVYKSKIIYDLEFVYGIIKVVKVDNVLLFIFIKVFTDVQINFKLKQKVYYTVKSKAKPILSQQKVFNAVRRVDYENEFKQVTLVR